MINGLIALGVVSAFFGIMLLMLVAINKPFTNRCRKHSE